MVNGKRKKENNMFNRGTSYTKFAKNLTNMSLKYDIFLNLENYVKN